MAATFIERGALLAALLLALVSRTDAVTAATAPVERIAMNGRALSLHQEPAVAIDSGTVIWDSGRVLSSLIQEEAENLIGSTVLEVCVPSS